jgi:glycosyltransferase involved in cell wall biosynthesis
VSRVPHVSVILPNYNYARYLRECVRSVLGQTYRDFELRYVDDASTDESNAIIESFRGDPRLTIRTFSSNSGTVYRRWNEAAREATGEWLWFPNADDVAHPRFLEVLVGLGDSDPRVAIVHARSMRIDAEGGIIGDGWGGQPELMQRLSQDYRAPGHEEILQLSGGCYLTTASGLIFRRSAYLEASGFDERLWGCADYDLYLRMLHRHDIAYTTEPLLYYRVHGQNTTTTTRSVVFYLAQAYCLAQALERMQGDPRYSARARESVLRRCRAGVFDMFQDPRALVPDAMGFAARAVYAFVPDGRLLRTAAASA